MDSKLAGLLPSACPRLRFFFSRNSKGYTLADIAEQALGQDGQKCSDRHLLSQAGLWADLPSITDQ